MLSRSTLAFILLALSLVGQSVSAHHREDYQEVYPGYEFKTSNVSCSRIICELHEHVVYRTDVENTVDTDLPCGQLVRQCRTYNVTFTVLYALTFALALAAYIPALVLAYREKNVGFGILQFTMVMECITIFVLLCRQFVNIFWAPQNMTKTFTAVFYGIYFFFNFAMIHLPYSFFMLGWSRIIREISPNFGLVMVSIMGFYAATVTVAYSCLLILNSLRVAEFVDGESADFVETLLLVIGGTLWLFWVAITTLCTITASYLLVNLKRFSHLSSQARRRFRKMTYIALMLIVTLLLARVIVPAAVLVIFVWTDRLSFSHIVHDSNISGSVLFGHVAFIFIIRPPSFVSRIRLRKSASGELKAGSKPTQLEDFTLDD